MRRICDPPDRRPDNPPLRAHSVGAEQPEDGPQYELIDGSIIVSPSATIDHNLIAHWIGARLDASNPGDDFVVGYDQSTTVDDHNEPRPDVVVADVAALRTTPFPIEDLRLAVEVVSYLHDTETKRALYARAGVPSYWIVIPDDDAPTIALAELVLDEESRQYRYRTHYTTESFSTDRPWTVTIDLPALTARREKLLRHAGDSP
jgi:Uma2 family endonuclease